MSIKTKIKLHLLVASAMIFIHTMPVNVNSASIVINKQLVFNSVVMKSAEYYKINDVYKLIIMQKIYDEAERQGINPLLALSVGWVESKYDQSARSKAGAVGIMQLMPIWGKGRYDIDQNIKIGVALLKERLEKDKCEYLALRYYNGGWKSTHAKYPKINKKTLKYANRVIYNHNKIVSML